MADNMIVRFMKSALTGLPELLKSIDGAACVTDAVILAGNAQAQLSISGTGVDVNSLTGGKYDVWTTVDCFIKIHATDATGVTITTGYPVYAAATPLRVVIPDTYALGAITSGAAGTLSYMKVD